MQTTLPEETSRRYAAGVGYIVLGIIACGFRVIWTIWVVKTGPAPKPVPWQDMGHQIWFNFAGSAMGWAIGYWLIQRFMDASRTMGVVDVLFALIAALGIVGYLPQTLNAIPGLLIYLTQLAQKKLGESMEPRPPKPSAAEQG